MKKFLKLSMIAFILVFLTVAAAACNNSPEHEDNSNEAVKEKLTIGMIADPDTLNPLATIDGNAGVWFANLSYPSLLTIDENGNPMPYAAEKYYANEDATVITYELRKDLQWSDGTPFTAQDVAYTKYVSGDLGLNAMLAAAFAQIEAVETPDDHTVVFKMKDSCYNFMNQVGILSRIIPKHIWENIDDPKNYTGDENSVCLGPYKLKEYKNGEYYIFEAVADTWFTSPGEIAMKELVFRIYPDLNAMSLALQNGEIDLTGKDLPFDLVQQLQNQGYQVAKNVSQGYSHLSFNLSNEFLADVNLRRAIAAALDKDTILQFTLKGQGVTMDSIIAPAFPDYQGKTPEAKYPSFDVDNAQQILADAGYSDTDGDGILNAPESGKNVSFKMSIIANDLSMVNGGDVVVQNLKELGINLEVEALERTTYIQSRFDKNFDCFYGSWGTMNASLGDFTGNYTASSPVYFHVVKCDDIEDAIYHMSHAKDDADLRQSLLEFEIAMANQCISIPLYVQDFLYIYNNDIINVTAYPSMMNGVTTPGGLTNIKPAS